MKQLHKYLCIWFDGGSVRGLRVTPCEIYILCDIYNAIIRKEKPEFIQQDIKDVLDKCGIKTVSSGIGWRVA